MWTDSWQPWDGPPSGVPSRSEPLAEALLALAGLILIFIALFALWPAATQ
jgi:asparagine N-glycosylation enzyme membrane subunit Stt3